jgi:ABC-type nickel/cobalt efflux system permease component RcnA
MGIVTLFFNVFIVVLAMGAGLFITGVLLLVLLFTFIDGMEGRRAKMERIKKVSGDQK